MPKKTMKSRVPSRLTKAQKCTYRKAQKQVRYVRKRMKDRNI